MNRADRWYPTGTLEEPFIPQEVDDITLAFPADISHLLPPAEKIPDEFCDHNYDSKWAKLFRDMFFRGIENLKLVPADGIDPDKAWRHTRAIMGSYEPKHEYKEAAVTYLWSLWYLDATWDVKKKESL